MDTVIGGVLLVLLLLAFGPSTRSIAGTMARIENPQHKETPQEQERANNDLVLLLALFAVLAVVLFVWKAGGAQWTH